MQPSAWLSPLASLPAWPACLHGISLPQPTCQPACMAYLSQLTSLPSWHALTSGLATVSLPQSACQPTSLPAWPVSAHLPACLHGLSQPTYQPAFIACLDIWTSNRQPTSVRLPAYQPARMACLSPLASLPAWPASAHLPACLHGLPQPTCQPACMACLDIWTTLH